MGGLHIKDGILEVYTGREALVEVPDGVHTIGEGAFKACVSMNKVILPSTVRRILAGAFKGCRNLEEIEIPDGVYYVGSYAFHRCHSLKKIALPASVTELGDCVFLYCDSLEEARIPGVRRLGVQVFVNDVQLQRLEVSAELQEDCICDVFTGCGALTEVSIVGGALTEDSLDVEDLAKFSGDVKELARVSRDVGKLTEFSRDAGALTKVSGDGEEVTEFSRVDGRRLDYHTGIGSHSGNSHANNSHVDKFRSDNMHYRFPNAVEAVVGEQPLPGLVRTIALDILRMMELDGRCMTTFRTNLKHVEIPEGIEKIGKSCFFDKRGILSVKFPKSLREIGSRAFRNCINLETVTFEGKDVSIHEDAFKNCSSLKCIHMPGGKQYRLEGLGGCKETMPGQVQAIQKQVLGNFRLSGSILLKYLGEESRVAVPEGVTRIAEEAFAGNGAIDRVLLPESLEEIGAGAFRGCVLLQTIALPEKVRRIGLGAFENCVKLLRVNLPQGLYEVEEKVFRKCRALKEVSFGEQLRSIGEQAFYGCAALKEVRFPESLASLGEMAFYRCKALREVRLPAGTEKVGSLAFAESGVQRAYISASGTGWGTGLFSDCMQLKTLVLEAGVRHIADRMAYGCAKLSQVQLPDSIASVGRNVWEKTPFLEAWLQGGQEQGMEIFWDGRNLEEEVLLPESVRIIAGGAFYGNKKLTGIRIPARARWIGAAAFKGCSALRWVCWPGGEMAADSREEWRGADRESYCGGYKAEPEVFSGCTQLEWLTACEAAGGSAVGKVRWYSIGERAFYHCENLQEICLGEAAVIGKEAFAGCTQLSLLLEADETKNELKSGQYFGTDQQLDAGEYPETRQYLAAEETNIQKCIKERNSNYKAPWIGERAFEDTPLMADQDGKPAIFGTIVISGSGCNGAVCLEEGITGIAPFAFSGNKGITSLVLPASLDWVGEGAFWGCSSLTEIRFPEKPCRIQARAFEKCISLREVELRASQLQTAAFAYCTTLKRAKIIGKSILPERLFEGCAELEACICQEVKAVKAHCFSGCRKLENFDFSRVNVVRGYAFAGCDSLRKVAFPDGACIGAHAFEDCGNLAEILLLGQTGEIRLREYAFSGCTALEAVSVRGKEWKLCSYGDILLDSIPEKVRLIFHSALSCFAVEKEEILKSYRGAGRRVRIPKGIRRIEAEVFRDVLGLEEVEIPDSVAYIGARAFHGTAWLERQREISPMVTVNHMLLDGSLCDGEVVVPEDVRMVCGWAFANGMGIERIHFLSERTRVEEYAFRNCINLKEIILPDGTCVALTGIGDREKELPPLAKQAAMDSMNCFKTDENGVLVECTGNITRLRMAEGITAIGEGAFQDGNLLTEAILPRTVTRLGKRAFTGCKWLRKVRQAQAVEEIGDMAFFGCGALEEVELSQHLQRFGIRAFEGCTSLEKILIPEGVEEIPDKAFYRCHSLRRVSFPTSLKRIGKEAFAFCRNLEEGKLPEGVLVEERAFVGCSKLTSLSDTGT